MPQLCVNPTTPTTYVITRFNYVIHDSLVRAKPESKAMKAMRKAMKATNVMRSKKAAARKVMRKSFRAMGKPGSFGVPLKRPALAVPSNDGPLLCEAVVAELEATRSVADFVKRAPELSNETHAMCMRGGCTSQRYACNVCACASLHLAC